MSNLLFIEEHPLRVVEEIIARLGTGLTFTYSRYEVAQPGLQAIAPRSDALRVRASEITHDWVNEQFSELKPNEELAWHSWVESEDVGNGEGFHIPMIDFINSPSTVRLCEFSQVIVTNMKLHGNFVFFQTGQSFHGYFPGLIPARFWSKYLGQLLTLNKNDWPQIIDTRWVAHALSRGFSALRWSNNTNRYRAIPHLIRQFR